MAKGDPAATKGTPSRRARVEAMRDEQRRAERRRSRMIVGSGVAVSALLVATVVVGMQIQKANDPARKPIASFGVPLAAASCQPEITSAASGVNDHVGPGTEKEDVTKVTYDTVPPTSGPHFAQAAPFGRTFYTARDRPAMETLVHNLEHGYAVVWYAESLPQADRDALRDLAGRLAKERGKEKLVVSAWDAAYGALPSGSTVAFSRWGAEKGYRQLCGAVSGEALQAFMDRHPSTDSPEPNAA